MTDTNNGSNSLEPTSSAAAARHGAPSAKPYVENPEPFAVGTILSRGFEIYARHFLPLTGLMLLVLSPWLVMNAVSTVYPTAGALTDLMWISTALSMITTPLATAAAVCAVAEIVRGRPPNVATSLRAMLPRALSVVGAALLTSIAIGVGTAFCIVPGLFLMAVLYVTMSVVLIEGVGVVDACKRSVDLTENHRWGTFFLAVVPMALNIVVGVVFTGVLPLAVVTGITSLSGVLFGALNAVFGVLAYIDLRNEKEPGFKDRVLDDALASLTRR